MYLRPVVYKIYAFIILIGGILGCGSIVASNFIASAAAIAIPGLEGYGVVTLIVSLVLAVIGLLYYYIEFSSMFAFGDMIKYEQSGATEPMKKKGFILPAKFYAGYGSAIYVITLLVSIVLGAYLIISYSIEKGALVALPILPLIAIVIINVFVSVHFNLRFKAISDLIRVKTGEVSETLRQSIAEVKTGSLRAYCTFYVGLSVVVAIATVVCAVIFYGDIAALLGTTGAILSLVGGIVYVIIAIFAMGIFGCYVDNIAKMIEHHQIKNGVFKDI
ncbi:MAG: hypothetical protein IIX27_06965 [Ruminococcus sp.]|nr:hypothetical protein [Ruminococcus sp.]